MVLCHFLEYYSLPPEREFGKEAPEEGPKIDPRTSHDLRTRR